MKSQTYLAIRLFCDFPEESLMNCRMYVRGEIDLATVSTLEADLARAIAGSDAHLVLDGSNLTFIDSSGIRAIVIAQATLEAQNRRLTIENLAPGPRRVFDALGIADRFIANPAAV